MQRFFANFKISRAAQAVTLAITVIALNALFYLTPIYRAIGADLVISINGLTNIAAAVISVWLGLRLWHASRHGESIRLIWGCLAVGLILWVIAEITWDTYQALRGIQMPTTSPADVAWMLGYVAVITGLVLRVYTFRMRLTKAWQFGVLALFGVAVVLVSVYMIIPLFNAPQVEASYERFVGLFYSICDLLMAFLALLLVLVLEGGLLSRPWATIALACLCVAVSNLLYAYTFSQGLYQIDPAAGLDVFSYIVDTFYTFAYVLMALGLYLQARLLEAI